MAQVRNGPVVRTSGPFAFLRVTLALRVLQIALLALLVSPSTAMAWGAQGHRITGLIADMLLTPRARSSVYELTGALSVADLVNWADFNRPGLGLLLDKSELWHYDDRPVCDAKALAVSYCPDGQCASAALARFEATLSNPAETADRRNIALRYLVHVMGDIHQPLHVGDNGDEGGNKINVALPGAQPSNLHSVWDSGLLQSMLRGTSEQGLAAGLREFYDDDIADWQRGAEREWMQESYDILQKLTYGALPGFQCRVTPAFVTRLPEAYVREAQSVVARQLVRSGVRIAVTLNRLLDPR